MLFQFRQMQMCRSKPCIKVRKSFYIFWSIFCLLDGGNTIIYFIAAAAIHETGHIAAILLSGNRIEMIEFHAAGICMHISRTKSYVQDLIISVSGPLAGIIAAMILAKFGFIRLAGANIILSAFNMMIIYPLDGACAAQAVLCMTRLGLCAVDILRKISVFLSAFLMLAGAALWYYTKTNPALFCIGIMLFYGNLRYYEQCEI